MASDKDILMMEHASLRVFAVRYSFLGFLLSLALLLLLSGCASIFEERTERYNTVAGERRVPVLNPGGSGRANVADASAKKVHKPVFEPGTPPQNPMQVPNYTANMYPTPPYQPPFQQVSGPVMLQPVMMPMMPQQMMMGNPMMMGMNPAMGVQPMVNTGGTIMPQQNMQAVAAAGVNQEIVTGPILSQQQAINLQQPGATISPLAQPSVNNQSAVADLKRQRAIAGSAQVLQANRQSDATWVDNIKAAFVNDDRVEGAPPPQPQQPMPLPSYEMASLPPQPMEEATMPYPAPPEPEFGATQQMTPIQMPDPLAPAEPPAGGVTSSPGFDPNYNPALSPVPAPQILPLPPESNATGPAFPAGEAFEPEYGAAMPEETGELLRRSASSAPTQQQQTVGGLTLTPPEASFGSGRDFLPDSRYNRRF